MKTKLALAITAAITAAVLLPSCMSSITTTTYPDGTVTVTELKNVDGETVKTVATATTTLVASGLLIRDEK